MKILLTHTFEDIISVDNLLLAWEEFRRGKRNRKDVHFFSLHLLDHIFQLHSDLANHTYKHGPYQAFNISDPKPRNIHKATVRDRLLHHAIYRILYPYFDRKFIFDSYSCRNGKGTHKALNRFRTFGRQVSKNHTKTCWVLKGDIRKFFASIDQEILLKILREYIPDQDILWLLGEVMGSFHTTREGVGLPLGNLTSQLLVNIYMNKFDQWVKHYLKEKYFTRLSFSEKNFGGYIRYADDFVILSSSRNDLEVLVPKLEAFLKDELKLDLHPDKLFLKTLASGMDFLGWVHFSDHRVLRTATRRRVEKVLKGSENANSLESYLGLLKHGNEYGLKRKLHIKIVQRNLL